MKAVLRYSTRKKNPDFENVGVHVYYIGGRIKGLKIRKIDVVDVIMSLKIHWPIIFSIRVCSLILIILLDWKMYKLQIIYYFILQDLILIQKWKHPKCQWKNHSNIKITIFQPFSVKRNLEGLNLLMGITSLYTSITVSTAH